MKKKSSMFGSLHYLYEIFTGELTQQDLQNLLTKDTRGMYEFYARNIKSVEGERNRVKRFTKLTGHLFVAFLLKLTPARRFLYAIAMLFFAVALVQGRLESSLYAFLIINFLLALELSDKLTTKDELDIARDIQLSLQPMGISSVNGLDLVSYSDVAKQVGGDYFDIIDLNDGHRLVVVGDVSGKGISSALYVSKVQTALQLFANETSDPLELLLRLNSHVYGHLKRNYFLTLLAVKVESGGRVQLCRAGHPPALLYRSADGSARWIKPNGIAVGIAPTASAAETQDSGSNADFRKSLELEDFRLDPGDILFLYTDGVSESVDRNGREFGIDRIAGLIKSFAAEPLERLRSRIQSDLAAHGSGTELRDDITFVLLKRPQ
jgi:sigma-B regulation protein RsbU (phosphoserine phosphatase)